MKTYQKVQALLTPHNKKLLVVLFFVSIVVSFFEMFALTLMMPFMVLATNFSVLSGQSKIAKFYSYFQFDSPINFVFMLGIVVLVSFILNAIISVVYTYGIARFSQSCYLAISMRFFESFLYMPYQQFTLTNSDTIRKLIFTDAGHCASIINASLLFISEACTITLIYCLLLYMNPAMTVMLSCLFLVLILCVRPISKFIYKQGLIIGNAQFEVNRLFTETYHNFKFIRLVSSEDYFSKRYHSEMKKLSSAQAVNGAAQITPRVMLETIGFFLLMLLVLVTLYLYRDPSRVIPIVSIYGFSFYRLLPSVNKLVINFNQIVLSSGAMSDLDYSAYLSVPLESEHALSFEKQISLQDVGFAYGGHGQLFKNFALTIRKGERIALVGPSGSGKSTFIGLVTGLLEPSSGSIYVDGSALGSRYLKSWRSKIGYIPQDIYLFDGTVAHNVVFGRAYDAFRLERALVRANIYDFLQTQQGVGTLVGEGGIRLSGGQKQRIGIARALYSDPEILILDEATSALDEKTERYIMEELYERVMGKTLIVISHRMNTVIKCDTIYEIFEGKVRMTNVSRLNVHHHLAA
jgi:ABC-type multidrug transport system fused ATPase/permease subunit